MPAIEALAYVEGLASSPTACRLGLDIGDNIGNLISAEIGTEHRHSVVSILVRKIRLEIILLKSAPTTHHMAAPICLSVRGKERDASQGI